MREVFYSGVFRWLRFVIGLLPVGVLADLYAQTGSAGCESDSTALVCRDFSFRNPDGGVCCEVDDVLEAPVGSVAEFLRYQSGWYEERSDFGKWISVRGGDRMETDVRVDGQSTMNVNIGNVWLGVNKTAIREITLETGGFSAEYGMVRSGLVNIVTRDGSRDRYTLNLEGRYSSPGLKHFGRNLYDRNGPTYVTRTGTGNFIPGEFSGGTFTQTGDPQNWGVRGEVVIDSDSPEYRGWEVVPDAWTENGNLLDWYKDRDGIYYEVKTVQRFGMEPRYAYPERLEWRGWQYFSGVHYRDNNWRNDHPYEPLAIYPADLLADWMLTHQGISYGDESDYDIDVTATGPVPGGNLPWLGRILGRSTFMTSYRIQTSRFVYPTARKAYRDRNLQAKLTTQITPSTTFRMTGLYGVAFSAQHYGNEGRVYAVAANSEIYYYNDMLNGPRESIAGYDGGGRLSGDLGRAPEDLFNEGENLQNTQYIFQSGAKLMHRFSNRASMELEYRFRRNAHNAEPNWPMDLYTNKYWIFNIDGMLNNRGESRTFITDDPADIFPDGIAQYFDPVRRQMVENEGSDLSQLPVDMLNARTVPFSSGGEGTWAYSRELVSRWFDQDRVAVANRMKGTNRLWLAQGFDDAGNAVAYEDPALLPGGWDLDHRMNQRRLPDLYMPRYGGLMNGATLPGITLVEGLPYYGGWRTGADGKDRTGEYYLYSDGRQITRATSLSNGSVLKFQSHLMKHHFVQAGAEFYFSRIRDMFTQCNGGCYFMGYSEDPNNPDDSVFDITGNVDARDWIQHDENPFQTSAWLQDRMQYRNVIAEIGLRMDRYDPTTETIDFSNPYRPEFSGSYFTAVENGPSHYHNTTEHIHAKARIYASPRISLGFPLNSSRLYVHYGWYYQPVSVDQLYSYSYFSYTGSSLTAARVPNADLQWPRTIKTEAGWDWHAQDWFDARLAVWMNNSDHLVTNKIWVFNNYTGMLISHMNQGYTETKGFEWNIERWAGLFRTRIQYQHYWLLRGETAPDTEFQNQEENRAYIARWNQQIHEIRPDPLTHLRWSLGLFTPRRWGWNFGAPMHPFGDISAVLLYTWRDMGSKLLAWNDWPYYEIRADVVDRVNTDLRVEKRLPVGTHFQAGIFLQVYNLFNNKYLVGPDDNQGIEDAFLAQYTENIRDGDQWGDYKQQHLSNTLPWFWDNLLFTDKRDVYYGITLMWQ